MDTDTDITAFIFGPPCPHQRAPERQTSRRAEVNKPGQPVAEKQAHRRFGFSKKQIWREPNALKPYKDLSVGPWAKQFLPKSSAGAVACTPAYRAALVQLEHSISPRKLCRSGRSWWRSDERWRARSVSHDSGRLCLSLRRSYWGSCSFLLPIKMYFYATDGVLSLFLQSFSRKH